MNLGTLFRFGPDSMLLVYALLVAGLFFLLNKTRTSLLVAIVATVAVSLLLGFAQWLRLEPAGALHQTVRFLFIVIPTVILLGVARVSLFTRRPWLMLLVAPVIFGTGYFCVCVVAGWAGALR